MNLNFKELEPYASEEQVFCFFLWLCLARSCGRLPWGAEGLRLIYRDGPPQSTSALLQCAASRAKHGRKLVQIGRDLLTELKHKNKVHKLGGTIRE